MCFNRRMFQSLIIFSLFVSFSTQQSTFSATSTGGSDSRVKSCAKCYYQDGQLPFNIQQQFGSMPSNDPRCAKWDDGIPVSEYEDCGTPLDGEANACVYLNMTAILENAVTNFLSQTGQSVAGLSNTGANFTNAISTPLNSFGNGDSSSNFNGITNSVAQPAQLASSSSSSSSNSPMLASVMQVVPSASRFGLRRLSRPKRQMMIGADNFPGFLSSPQNTGSNAGGIAGLINSPTQSVSNAGSSALSSSPISQGLTPVTGGLSQVSNVFNTGSAIGSSSNTGPVKMYYKGCVRLSILETMAGPHCKIVPEMDDIRFFSQQALLAPLSSAMLSLQSSLAQTMGLTTKVDGLCYYVNKEFARQLWKTMLHFASSS